MLSQFTITAVKDEARVKGLVLRVGQTVSVDLDSECTADLQRKVDSDEIAVLGMSKSALVVDRKVGK